MKKLICLMVLAVVVLSGCKVNPSPSPTPATVPEPEYTLPPFEPVEAMDLLNELIRLESPADRLVVLSPANALIVLALGLADRVVGIVTPINPADFPNAAIVGDYDDPDAAAIAALDPGIVLAAGIAQKPAIDALRAQGFCVAACEAVIKDEVRDAVNIIGALCLPGENQFVNDLALSADEALYALAALVEDQPRQTVYFAVGFGTQGEITVCRGTYIDELMDMSGLDNVVETYDPTQSRLPYTREQLEADDPDIIFLSSGAKDSLMEFILEYNGLRAVSAGRVYTLESDTPLPTLAMHTILEEILTALYPDLELSPAE